MKRESRLALLEYRSRSRTVVAAARRRVTFRYFFHAPELLEYDERRRAALRRIYGERWEEVYSEQTMLKDEDYGMPDE